MDGSHYASFEVPHPLSEWEMDDIKSAIKNILNGRTFFYAGEDDLGDEVRIFLIDHPVESNLELVDTTDGLG